MIKKISAYIAAIFFVILILFADTAKQGVINGLELSFSTAIPALFPFLVASALLSQTGMTAKLGRLFSPVMRKIYGLPSECAGAIVLGLTGGYPVGVSAAVDLYKTKHINKVQTERLLGFCNNTGPAFIVGVCGVGILSSVKLGLVLYFIHIASALICGRFFAIKTPELKNYKYSTKNKNIGFSESLVVACEQAAQTSIKVAGFLTFFSVLTALLQEINIFHIISFIFSPVMDKLNISPDIVYPICYGFFEITRGLAILPEVYLPTWVLLSVMSAILAFGGLSVMCQAMSIAKPLGLSMKYCVVGKLLHSLLAFIMSIICSAFLPQTVPAMAGAIYIPTLSKPCSIVMLILILFILTTSKHKQNTL